VLLVRSGGFAVPEFIYVACGTTEVVPFYETLRARVPSTTLRAGPLPHGRIIGTKLIKIATGRLSGLSDESKMRVVVCVGNRSYPAGLELGGVYRVLADERASGRRLLRVVDESGEDYLYPEEYFAFV